MDFKKEYGRLNKAQKAAVDQIDGPLLVVAGPGTGKTQLLSTRAANILDKTDTPPSSILCLTFTDSAARTMRNRLISIIGEDAYHIAIHTFHSFGLEVMGQYPQYFSDTAGFGAIDDVTRHEIVESILAGLPKSNPLAAKNLNGELVWISAVQNALSQLKKGALSPKQLENVIDANEEFIDYANPILNEALTGRWSGQTVQEIVARTKKAVKKLREFKPAKLPGEYKPLSEVLAAELEEVLAGEPQGLKDWRDKRMVGKDGERRLKDHEQLDKFRSLANVYTKYQRALNKRKLHDYEDMILEVTRRLEEEPDLLAELQERYLYVQVDEFQDTSDAQLNLLLKLGDNPVFEGRPNIMAVGDDDQAIFRFQGAELSNMLSFIDAFSGTGVICITENYRSSQDILDLARYFAGFGQQRLEKTLKEVDKTLSAAKDIKSQIKTVSLPDVNSERHWVAKEIKKLIEKDVPPEKIAVIGRYHDDLIGLLPHLDVPVRYERRDDVLAEKHVHELVTMARAVVALNQGDHDRLKGLLSEILNYEFWHISVPELWKFALKAKKHRGKHWYQLMLESKNPQIKLVASTLGELARREPTHTTETIFDWLIGNSSFEVLDTEDEINSPFKSYYFSHGTFQAARMRYVDMLSSLSALRNAYRQWRTKDKHRLRDFVEFIDAVESANIRISDTAPHREDENAVQVMTAHGAKGQEFEAVFIINATGEAWDKPKRGGTSLSWPANLPLASAGDEEDDRARIFFVAATRAERYLYISAPQTLENGKEATKLRFLSPQDGELPEVLEPESVKLHDTASLSERLSSDWASRHRDAIADNRAVLAEHLERYQLSPTDFNAFLDVTKGGPQSFLINNLLRFPSAKSPNQAFGTAIHTALAQAHAAKGMPLNELQNAFQTALDNEDLSQEDYERELEHGLEVLAKLHASPDTNFDEDAKVEYPFSREGVVVNGARLTGRVDKITLTGGKWNNNGTVKITDWKTGRPRTSWRKSDLGLTKARQQLYFYKLLLENSRSFKGILKSESAELMYVEGPSKDKSMALKLDYDNAELKRTAALISAVWQKIMDLDFPDTSHYEQSYKGVEQFEEDLLG